MAKKFKCPRPINRLVMHRAKGLSGPFYQGLGGGRCIKTQGNYFSPGGAGSIRPVFHGIYPDSSGEMQGVLFGDGPLSVARVADIWLPDWEGIYRQFLGGEIGYRGGRKVTNEITYSEDFANAAWLASGGTVKAGIVPGIGPDGESAMEVSMVDVASLLVNNSVDHDSYTGFMVSSALVRAKTGTFTLHLKSGSRTSVEITIDENWKRISAHRTNYSFTSSSENGIVGGAVAGSFYLINFQAEKYIDGIPGEYIKTTNGPATKVFATNNGNTVTANVVTEAKGADLPEMPYVVRAPQATNYFLNNLTPITQTISGRSGVHTVWCKGAGTVTLSGGLTGVVSDGNPITGDPAGADVICTVGGALDFVQFEGGSVPSPMIPTNGSSESRDADSYSFDSANWRDTEGTVYLEADLSEVGSLILDGMLSMTDGIIELNDGTYAVRAAALVQGSCQIGWTYNTAGMRLCVDGTWSETVPYDGGMLQGLLDLFRSATVTGMIRDIRIWAVVNETVIYNLMPDAADYGTDFVMVVKTTTASETFTVPCQDVGTFDCTIDWGDGSADSTITTYNDADLAHTYDDAGLHVVTISGDFPNIYFNNAGDKDKVIGVLALGVLTALNYGLYGCTNLVCVGEGDVSSITSLSNSWRNNDLISFPLLDVGAGTNFSSAWYGNDLTSFPLLDVSSGINFAYAWYNNNLTSFPLLDVSSGENFSYAWYGNDLTSFPLLDVGAGTNFTAAWYGNPLVDFPAGMFDSCLATNYTTAFVNCALSQQSVDGILVSIDTAGQSGGTLNIDGGTSSPPSAVGLAAKASLEGKGWTVTVNS